MNMDPLILALVLFAGVCMSETPIVFNSIREGWQESNVSVDEEAER
jgi:hypothetical protein